MSARLSETRFSESLAKRLAAPPTPGTRLYWLGQAGFILEMGGARLVIDPYLSDTLAAKYADSPYSHARMTPAPVSPDELGHVDLVLCTHRHTDHMDPGTLAPLARRLPNLRFVAPVASTALACERAQIHTARLIPLDAGDVAEPWPGLALRALRAVHETIERDATGRCLFLGYALSCGGSTVFHSGDCVPFPGQVEEVAEVAPDIALLPVNGRSKALRQAGFPGNFHVEEAVRLCDEAGIPAMIAHHYGLFAFNTADPDVFEPPCPARAARCAPRRGAGGMDDRLRLG